MLAQTTPSCLNSSTSVDGAAYICFLIIIIYVLICYCRLHYCFHGCFERRFLTIVFPLLEPMLITNHLHVKYNYTHAVFTRRIEHCYEPIRSSGPSRREKLHGRLFLRRGINTCPGCPLLHFNQKTLPLYSYGLG